jgi:hypothetical protein
MKGRTLLEKVAVKPFPDVKTLDVWLEEPKMSVCRYATNANSGIANLAASLA